MTYDCTAPRFLADVANHQMTVGHDDGVHRCIKFAKPQNEWHLHFTLTTWRGHLMALEMSPWQDRRRVQDEVGRILASASKGRYREWLAGGVPGVALRGPALANPPTLEVARAEVYTMIMLVLRFGEQQRGKVQSRKEL